MAWLGLVHRRSTNASVAVLAALALLAPAVAGASVTPVFLASSSNLDCPQLLGPGNWIELKVDPPRAGTYTDGVAAVHVTNYAPKSFDWSSNVAMDAVFVKAGSKGSNLYVYDPEVKADTQLVSPADKGNDISHIAFCYDLTADITVSKVALAEEVRAGDPVAFRIVVSNLGPDPARDVRLSDPLPVLSGAWSVAGPDASACTLTSGSLACAWPVLHAGATREVVVSAGTSVADAGVVRNVATATSRDDGAVARAEASARVVAPDVAVTKTALAASVEQEDEIAFRLDVASIGSDPASDVRLEDALPATPAGWQVDGPDAGACTLVGLDLACAFGTLAPGATRSVTVRTTAEPGTGPLVENVARVTATFDVDLSNNVASDATRVLAPLTSLTKSVRLLPDGEAGTTTPAAPGDEVEYRIVVENAGDGVARAVRVEDALPARTAFVSCDGCDADADTLAWDVGDLAAGAFVELAFVVRLDATFPAGTTVLPNTATGASRAEPSLVSNTVLVVVSATPLLGVAKATDAAAASAGDGVRWTIHYWNSGDGDATGVVLADALPAGTSLVACDPDCTVVDGVVVWDVGTVPGLTSAEAPAGAATVTVRLDAPVGCEVCNVATLTSADAAPATSDASCVPLVADVDLAEAEGAAFALSVRFVDDVQTFSRIATRQVGEGVDVAHVGGGPLVVTAPDGRHLVTAETLRSTSASAVLGRAEATQTTTAQVLGLDILDGLVRSSELRAVAATTSDPWGATTTNAGSALAELVVAGERVVLSRPGDRVDLSALFGAGSGIEVMARAAATGLAHGVQRADATTTALVVRLVDVDPLTPGDQTLEVLVASATAATAHPEAPSCADPALLGAAAEAAGVAVGPLTVGNSGVSGTGEDSDAHADVALPLASATAVATTSRAVEGVVAEADAQVAGLCLLAGCEIRADALESWATVDADGAVAGARLAGLVVFGEVLCPDACTPAPNTVVDLPGIGFLVLNEQTTDDDACAPQAEARALRLVLLDGTELVVGASAARLARC